MDALAMLDRALARDGEPMDILQTGTYVVLATVQALVRGYKPEELIQGSGLIQGDRKLILSPSGILAAGLPWPKPNDYIRLKGKTTNVQGVDLIKIGSAVVRVEIQARGG